MFFIYSLFSLFLGGKMENRDKLELQLQRFKVENLELKKQLDEDRKKFESLNNSEVELRALFHAMTDLVIELDNNGYYINIAPTSPLLLYKPADDLIGKKLHDVFSESLADIFINAINITLSKNEISTLEYYLYINGTQIWFEARISPKTENTVLFIAHEITDKVIANQKLEESRNKYHQIIDTVSVSIWEEDFTELEFAIDNLKAQGVVDFRTYFEEHPQFVKDAIKMIKVIDVNNETLKMYKAASKKEFLEGLQLTLVDESLSTFTEELIAIAEGKKIFEAEEFTRNLKGERVDILFRMTIPPEGESYDHVLISMMDITDIKKTRQKLINSQEHVKMINRILRHDISNCFNVINSALKLYRRDKESYLLDEIERHMKKGVNLIRSMREMEQIFVDACDCTLVDINKTILEITSHYTNVDFDFDLNDNIGKIYANNSVSSVIDNLVSNSLKHSGSKKIAISTNNKGDKIELKIADFGKGIPDSIKEKIFEEHYKYGSTGNTGLGLYIVRKLMDHYNGSVHVEDNKPQGTIMVLEFIKQLNR